MRLSAAAIMCLALSALSGCDSSTSSAPASHSLAIELIGDGPGSVASSPPGIECGETCEASFQEGTSITLTATPGTGSTFGGWSGAGCSGTGTCVVVLNTGTTVTATFTLNSYELTVDRDGAGTGRVVSDPAGIDCGGECSATFGHGTTVTLTAVPDDGFSFIGWTAGPCAGVQPCEITLTQAAAATATFGVLAVAWPDSHTRYCMGGDGLEVDCPGGAAGQDGHYQIHVPVYTTVGGRVHDSVTGLTWERLPPLQPITRPASATYCAQLELDGLADWRIPSRLELATLVDAGRAGPPFPASVFPGIPGNSYFWSRNANPADPTESYAFNTNWATSRFRDNDESEPSPGDTHIVRCVRGPALANDLSAVGNTVVDAGTGLVWQSGVGGLMTWEGALAYCEALELDGSDDWRLPSIKEWFSNVDDGLVDFPRISVLFAERPATSAERRFWSSTPLPWDNNSDVQVFDTGPGNTFDIGNDPEGAQNVRCVRS